MPYIHTLLSRVLLSLLELTPVAQHCRLIAPGQSVAGWNGSIRHACKVESYVCGVTLRDHGRVSHFILIIILLYIGYIVLPRIQLVSLYVAAKVTINIV